MSWLDKFADIFKQAPRVEEFKRRHKISLKKHRVLIPFKYFPLQISFDGKDRETLHIYPEQPLSSWKVAKNRYYLIFEPEQYSSGIAGFLRLEKGQRLLLGKHDEAQQRLLRYGPKVSARHLLIEYAKEGVIFHKTANDTEVLLRQLKKKKPVRRLCHRRVNKLGKIKKLFGNTIELLPPEQALAELQQANALLANEALRPPDKDGAPGGVVMIPDKLIPIIIGDLHAQIDNLLQLFIENSFFDMLNKGRACLIILGDAVHSEEDDKLDQMEDSLLMMDLLIKLKLRFPTRFFYLRGNHDSFAEEISKGGVPQGLLWKKAVLSERGEAYFEALQEFYTRLPYLAIGPDFIACHAGPPGRKVTLDQLINIRSKPQLKKDIVRSRLKRPGYPSGYTKGDIKNFRKSLKLKKDTPFIVSHNPLSEDKAVWLDVGGIPGHHIVFSGKTHSIAVFTRVNGIIQPLTWPAENLRQLIKAI